MKKRYIIIGLVLMLLIGIGIGNVTGSKETYSMTLDFTPESDEEINFVEVYFPNVSTGSSPLGNEVFALSFIVKEIQHGYQTYGGRNLVAEGKSIHIHDRIIGLKYNYFVVDESYNVTLIVRDGELIDAVVEST